MQKKNIYLIVICTFLFLLTSAYSASVNRDSNEESKRYLCTTQKTNYIRALPNVRSKKIVRLNKHVPLQVIGKSKNWFKVAGYKYNKFIGWVHNSIVTNKFSCMIINKTFDVLCYGNKKVLPRLFYMHEGFKVLKKEIACNLVEDRYGKKYKIDSLEAWPKSVIDSISI
jgi:hypothetical protein